MALVHAKDNWCELRPRSDAIHVSNAKTDVSRQDHQHLIEASPDGILLTLQNRITYANQAAIELFGATAMRQLVGRSFFEFFETTAPTLPQLQIQDLMASGQGGPLAAIGKLHRLDDQAADIELLSAPYRGGDDAGSLLILHALSASDCAFTALSVPPWALDLIDGVAALAYVSPDRVCRFINPVHEAWFGTAHDSVAEWPLAELWRAAHAQFQSDIDAALKGATTHSTQCMTLAHGVRSVGVVCTPDRSRDNRLRGVSILLIDLGPASSDRQPAFALPRSADSNPATAPALIAQLDRNYRLRFVNDGYAARFDLAAANGGRRITDFVSNETFTNLCRYAEASETQNAAGIASGRRKQEQDLLAAISDITRLRRTEDQLYRREREFKTLVENSPDVIARIGRDMRHLYVSPAIETIFGLAPAACLGKTKAELGFAPSVVKMWDAAIGRAFERGSEQQFGFSRTLREQVRHFSVRIIPEFDRGGKVESVLGITYDITERTRLEQEREQLLRREREARIQAETAARARDEFLAIVSHELRGPLNGIQSWAHVLENFVLESGATPLAQRALHGIRTGVDQQVRLIEDLLDVTRMMSGRLRLVKRPFSALPAIQAAVESIREAAAAKNIAISTRYHIATEKIDGDPDRVQQVVWNLMSNAVKFTPENGRVDVGVSRTDGHIRIAVADNGAGIAPDFLPYLFDRFSQKDTSSTRGHSGLGLGLFLVRHLVELHGGRIEAESRGEGQGATFTLFLPLRATPESYAFSIAADADAGISRRLPSLAGRHLLLLDDQEEAREAQTAVLTAAGARVFAAASTAEIFRWLREVEAAELPDTLICDIAMPGEDGYAALRRIRAWKSARGETPLQRLPALALTAFSQPEDRIHALTAGFQMHLTKPVAPDELLVVLASIARR